MLSSVFLVQAIRSNAFLIQQQRTITGEFRLAIVKCAYTGCFILSKIFRLSVYTYIYVLRRSLENVLAIQSVYERQQVPMCKLSVYSLRKTAVS